MLRVEPIAKSPLFLDTAPVDVHNLIGHFLVLHVLLKVQVVRLRKPEEAEAAYSQLHGVGLLPATVALGPVPCGDGGEIGQADVVELDFLLCR